MALGGGGPQREAATAAAILHYRKTTGGGGRAGGAGGTTCFNSFVTEIFFCLFLLTESLNFYLTCHVKLEIFNCFNLY